MHYLCVLLFLFSLSTMATVNEPYEQRAYSTYPPFVNGQLLVKIDPQYSSPALYTLEETIGAKIVHSYSLVNGLYLYKFDENVDMFDALKLFYEHKAVIYAEPNYLYKVATDDALITDPEYSKQWALENRGQTQGKIDADINAEAMWALQKGNKNIVVGIIDTGIDYTHPDLASNVWKNPAEVQNGKDDDQNGYIDDLYGINAIKKDGNPMDDNVHGTHVAGTIGAVGNNGIGVVGVAQTVQIAACKFLSSGGSGSTADALTCMEYFARLKSRTTNPVNIVATNNSWGGGGSSQAMLDAIKAHEQLGILFIAAAGNESNNNDVSDSFPANYEVSNVIAVAATDNLDKLASFSNYGKKKVHVAAPGVKILSTVLGHKYGELSGTSMATPHVTGLAAIIASHYSNLSYTGIKNLILAGGQKIDAAANTTISGRRIRGADTGGVGSLTCNNQFLTVRIMPTAASHRIQVGRPLFLSAININCAQNGGALTLYHGPLGDVTLKDDGTQGDVKANDGIYSLNWTPTAAGAYDLKFGDSDIVNVTVYDHTELHPYVANDQIPYEYETIGGQRLHAGDDTMHQIAAPFPIQFGGAENAFSDLYISSNGTISFTDRSQPGYQNQSLPTTVANTLVAPFWDDLIALDADGDIYTAVTGAAPNRRFIVEWWKIQPYRATGLGAFQVVFYENNSDVRFNYLDTNFSSTAYNFGASATVGLQISRDSALTYSFNAAKVQSQKSVIFSRE